MYLCAVQIGRESELEISCIFLILARDITSTSGSFETEMIGHNPWKKGYRSRKVPESVADRSDPG